MILVAEGVGHGAVAAFAPREKRSVLFEASDASWEGVMAMFELRERSSLLVISQHVCCEMWGRMKENLRNTPRGNLLCLRINLQARRVHASPPLVVGVPMQHHPANAITALQRRRASRSM